MSAGMASIGTAGRLHWNTHAIVDAVREGLVIGVV